MNATTNWIADKAASLLPAMPAAAAAEYCLSPWTWCSPNYSCGHPGSVSARMVSSMCSGGSHLIRVVRVEGCC